MWVYSVYTCTYIYTHMLIYVHTITHTHAHAPSPTHAPPPHMPLPHTCSSPTHAPPPHMPLPPHIILKVRRFPPCLRGACLHANLTRSQRDKVLKDVSEGIVQVLLLSPEALVGGANWGGWSIYSLRKLPPVAFACIDEAHCLSSWSHNFRPSYLRLNKVVKVHMYVGLLTGNNSLLLLVTQLLLVSVASCCHSTQLCCLFLSQLVAMQVLKESLGVSCILAITATATKTTAASVSGHLNIAEENIIRGTALPDNLIITVSCVEDKEKVC